VTGVVAMTGNDSLQIVIDEVRLNSEMEAYSNWLDERTEEAYKVAAKAKQKRVDFSEKVEIPRAADLASRTEKLLEEYLRPEPDQDPIQIQDDLRKLLSKEDRETASIRIAVETAKKMHALTSDVRRSIDTGLRVGLAVLTEAVLVAPLEGIGDVKILNNEDGTEFLSIEFCGPIRAAGGTAQALGVMIGDMVRRELGLNRYIPTTPEVERVKEEFGLYRVGLQYKPTPEEIEIIVRSCPVMINGEPTEQQECSSYKEVRNIDSSRVRGGVMLVIGEGLCLKAPKIQKHTERLDIQGWEFIGRFASKGKSEDDQIKKFKARTIPKNERFLDDVIAGRPVFSGPNSAGGFRLRYGRSRASGLAAAGINPVSMEAMGSFLSVGTQMKVERPGKAAAVTPAKDIDGPTVLLDDGAYIRIDTIEEWREIADRVDTIWDSGEMLVGFGEFLENNKNLVPSAYNRDWFASELAEILDQPSKVDRLAEILQLSREDMPPGLPFNGAISRGGEEKFKRMIRRRDWDRYLRNISLNWLQVSALSTEFGTAIPPPWNPWWSDLSLTLVNDLVRALLNGYIEAEKLVIPNVVGDWNVTSKENMNLSQENYSERHGKVKSSLMILGISHIHVGDDIVIPSHWEALLEGLGLKENEGKILQHSDAGMHVKDREGKILNAQMIVDAENKRLEDLQQRKRVERVRAETAARQRGLGISETEAEGFAAAALIEDPGIPNLSELEAARRILDDHEVEGCLWLVRRMSNLRWEDSVPCRVGSRMGRPEKASRREMKPMVHSLFPIGDYGGPQRLLSHAANQGQIRVEMGPRICQDCGRESPFLKCHHRPDPGNPKECGGITKPREIRGNRKPRRLGQRTSVSLARILEVKRRSLGIDVLPKKIKAVKGLMSYHQTPEPIEKGILRAHHNVSVFRDGTARYDMIDVPVTHFRPCEINSSVESLVNLGYTHDVDGQALVNEQQIVELFPQDFIPSSKAIEHLSSTCDFVDQELIKIYGGEPFYNVTRKEDLLGHLAIGLAPHTSGGVLCRIIGWTKASAGYAHPLFHAAKRRNCDGDEDSIMMLMDGLLNFSRLILPANRGGRMDAPLVLTTRLNPFEIDKEALNVDCGWFYPRHFYEATQHQPHPSELKKHIEIVEHRLGSVGDLRGYGWTHDSGYLDAGPANSSYKILETMVDKMRAQLELGRILRSVDVSRVASQVIESHFLPDLRGNLVAFSRQKVRCVRCGAKFRRMPLSGKCIANVAFQDDGNRLDRSSDNSSICGGNVILTVSEGSVRKYIEITQHVIENYGVDLYTKQRVDWLSDSVDSLFNDDTVTVMTLDDFF
tara:strand:+ start:1358 stop:5326 length:3969 start_codon:yes stop_codon:yes gene_type:complete